MRKTIFLLLALTLSLGKASAQPETLPAVKQWKATKGEVTLSSQTTVTATNPALQKAADVLKGSIANLPQDGNAVKVIELALAKKPQPGSEAYTIEVKKNKVTVQGDTEVAVLWGVQSLRQLLMQSPTLACGTITDRPDYALRGFMIDCGRKYIPMDYLYNLVDMMSYYKMNCLQVHLNDNGFKKYHNQRWDMTYSAFRMESELFPELTARDGHYTKKEFREFVKYAAKLGVDIIPEIDAPAHALAFTHFRPSLGCEEFGVDHFDLTNPEVVPFIDSLWTEYIGGSDPVFAGPRVHIGTDEYSNKKQEVVELFRQFTDHYIKFIQQHGKQPVVWGSLTYAKGETPVQVDGVLMDMWSNGFANPKEMHDAGYKMVSIPDGYVYIVPLAGYYYDYLNCQFLYEHWTPANIGGVQFEERDPLIEGGMFAVWNDVTTNGVSVGDIHHRTVPAMQVIAEKTWHAVNDTVGYAKWDALRQRIHCYDYELGNVGEAFFPAVKPNTSISHDGHEAQIGFDYEVSFDIQWAQEQEGAVLAQSNRSKFYLCDPISGMLGYSRDGHLYTFNYSLRPGLKEHITIKGTSRGTSLWVNGKHIQTLGQEERVAHDGKPYKVSRSLLFPLTETGNFKSTVTNFTARKL